MLCLCTRASHSFERTKEVRSYLSGNTYGGVDRSFGMDRKHPFWTNYILLLITWVGYYWWMQVAYSYQPIARLPAAVLEIILLFCFGVLMALLGGTETQISQDKKPLWHFLLSVSNSCLRKKIGIVLPFFLLVLLVFLFWNFRHIRIQMTVLVSANLEAPLGIFIRQGEQKNQTEITQHIRAGSWIQGLDKHGDNWPALVVHDEYGFFEESILLTEEFDWSDYLLGKITDPSSSLDLDRVTNSISVSIRFPEADSGLVTEVTGQLNPTSYTWETFEPPNNTKIPDFFCEVAGAFRSEPRPSAPGQEPICFQVPRGAKTGVFTATLDVGTRTLDLVHNSLPDATGLSPVNREKILNWCDDIVHDNHEVAVQGFCRLFGQLKSSIRNELLRDIIVRFDKSPGWRYPLSTIQLRGYGSLLMSIVEDPEWIAPENIRTLFDKSFSFINEGANPRVVENPMRALLRLAGTPVGTSEDLQSKLFERLTTLLTNWGHYNNFRLSFLDELSSASLLATVPSKDSIELFVTCLRVVGTLGSNDVRSKVIELIDELRPKWGENDSFRTFQDEIIKRREWRLNNT